MSQTLFISDLHLAAERPHITRQFRDFARLVAPRAEALYVLGDLFEYWIGDDDLDDPLNSEACSALRGIADAGVRLFYLHGNRDLLTGRAFAERCGATVLADPVVIDLHGTRTLLMHGDTLCTDDVDYQKFRAYARDPRNQAAFLGQPVAARREQMLGMRAKSEAAKGAKAESIMDVSPAAVEAALREHHVVRLIHGHTHRPARHTHIVDGMERERWVLTDWYRCGGYLQCDASGCSAVTLPL